VQVFPKQKLFLSVLSKTEDFDQEKSMPGLPVLLLGFRNDDHKHPFTLKNNAIMSTYSKASLTFTFNYTKPDQKNGADEQ